MTLALGIGASAAIFSIVHEVLLRPLPFPDPQQLVSAWPVRADRVSMADHSMSVPDLDDWRATQHEFVRLGAYWYATEQSGLDLTGFGQPTRLRAAQVTPGFFETLGVRPALGRLPTSDEMAEGGPRVVVISDGLWHRQFGSDSCDHWANAAARSHSPCRGRGNAAFNAIPRRRSRASGSQRCMNRRTRRHGRCAPSDGSASLAVSPPA